MAAVLGGAFFGFFLYTDVTNPPTQVLGVCPAPAYIAGNGCWQRVCLTNGQNQQTCSIDPAGTIIGTNMTRIVGGH